jgi:hypothetical protein
MASVRVKVCIACAGLDLPGRRRRPALPQCRPGPAPFKFGLARPGPAPPARPGTTAPRPGPGPPGGVRSPAVTRVGVTVFLLRSFDREYGPSLLLRAVVAWPGPGQRRLGLQSLTKRRSDSENISHGASRQIKGANSCCIRSSCYICMTVYYIAHNMEFDSKSIFISFRSALRNGI